MRRFSARVRLPNGRGSWKLRARPSRVRWCAVRPFTAAPPKRTLPCSLFRVPQMQFTRVDLPDPLAGLDLELDLLKRHEASEALAEPLDVQQRGHRCLFLNRPTMPCGARITKATSRRPVINTFTADEMVTLMYCCRPPTRMPPTTGPIQLEVPPISGMAIALTA